MGDYHSDAIKVISALSSSEAYNNYRESINNLNKKYEQSNQTRIIDINRSIGYAKEGGLLQIQKMYSYIDSKTERNTSYEKLNKIELDYLIKYFEDKGYNITYSIDIPFKYKLIKLFTKFTGKMFDLELNINWDFSK